ncbi:MAG: thiamine pyrophosphate-dependent dehydrogenase E1 component subunit alpha, partial [Phaeodactylibacter sp.]|nr:thiamine pyrophosphate-dependent dehydrogenase E1 component subunit alpha [Phaeodactylibacter sp.]
MIQIKPKISRKALQEGFRFMATAKAMTEIYEKNFKFVAKYVHATSRGHEAIQLAVALQLKPQDFLYPYYRDDAMLLGIGMRPYELMLQLMAKRDDPFSGGRTYYAHPSLRDPDKPQIPHQSSATGMQAIPATGAAMGLLYKEKTGLATGDGLADKGIVVCSLGDASVTEGEVSEAFQMAALKQLPIIYLVQDNGWDISAKASETRAQDADEFVKGFHGLETRNVDGSDFFECYLTMREVIQKARKERRPFLVRAKVPLLNHHTSGVRREWYRDDLEAHLLRDPYPVFRNQLIDDEIATEEELLAMEEEARQVVQADFEAARQAENPQPEDLFTHDFAPTPITEEKGEREPAGGELHVMVDSALFAVEELMRKHKECLLYGQDVG